MKKVICRVIESVPKDWSVWGKVIDRDKYKNFDKSRFPDPIEFCDKILTKNLTENSQKIEILERIGSESAEGEVYRIKYGDMEFALKLMPRMYKDSENKNFKEIEIANLASQYPDYFPMTFAYGFCPNSSYYIGKSKISAFIAKTVEYNTISNILQSITSKIVRKRFEADYRNGMTINELKKKYLIDNVPNENSIQVDFLISELANGDLGNWCKVKQDIQYWRKILIDVIFGIYYLTVMIGKVHPDLHLGNILILKGENDIRALIHDFGRCYAVDKKIPVTYKATLLSFCTKFLSCAKTRSDLFIPREIILTVQGIYDTIQHITIAAENIKEIYEQTLYPFLQIESTK